VDPADAPELLAELKEGLLSITDPRTGARVFGGARTRDELYSGPASETGPDMMLDTWSAGYRVAPGRVESDDDVIAPAPLAGVNEAWSSDHRPLGVFVGAGPLMAHGSGEELSLYDVCPTALALLEQAVPDGLDGRPATEAFERSWMTEHPLKSSSATRGERGRRILRGRGRCGDLSPEGSGLHRVTTHWSTEVRLGHTGLFRRYSEKNAAPFETLPVAPDR
jgi:hypothetical protein